MAPKANMRPIVRRKKIIVADGHHGGAWKVAYADFVTAMMAFFMLMWLLGATTEKQRKGIADYFNPTIPVNRVSGGGQDAFGGDSVFSEETLIKSGTGGTQAHATSEEKASGNTGVSQGDGAEDTLNALAEVEAVLLAQTGDSVIRDLIRKHIVTEISERGLVIELFDTDTGQLFDVETGAPSATLQQLMPTLTEALSIVENPVEISGHVISEPVVLREHRAWDRSLSRADAVRRSLEDAGLAPTRVARMTGHGDRAPATANPMAPRNSRIEIVLLRTP